MPEAGAFRGSSSTAESRRATEPVRSDAAHVPRWVAELATRRSPSGYGGVTALFDDPLHRHHRSFGRHAAILSRLQHPCTEHVRCELVQVESGSRLTRRRQLFWTEPFP